LKPPGYQAPFSYVSGGVNVHRPTLLLNRTEVGGVIVAGVGVVGVVSIRSVRGGGGGDGGGGGVFGVCSGGGVGGVAGVGVITGGGG
jgi:hypothetical protein